MRNVWERVIIKAWNEKVNVFLETLSIYLNKLKCFLSYLYSFLKLNIYRLFTEVVKEIPVSSYGTQWNG